MGGHEWEAMNNDGAGANFPEPYPTGQGPGDYRVTAVGAAPAYNSTARQQYQATTER